MQKIYGINRDTLKHSLSRTLFPQRCPICGEVVEDDLICRPCRRVLVPVAEPKCRICGRHLSNGSEDLCDSCRTTVHFFNRVFSLFPYNDVIKKSIADFKYHGKCEYARFYAAELYDKFYKELVKISPDVIIPVPIHIDRLSSRGYNQASLITSELSKLTGIPEVTDLLLRTGKTIAQKELGPDERRKNLKSAFSINKNSDWFSKYIKAAVLVDDIYTTGSTLDACSNVLKRFGIKYVYAICVASVES